ncbi:MAG: exo-alpha-sialidase [Pirellulales bacterium]|nr:exo-alpha-sialidase [Pirellulales bacterium]
MKPAVGMVLLLGIFISVPCLSAEPSFERSVIASHEDIPSNCYPCLARLENGRLMIVWSGSGKEGSHIVGAFSEDHGKTWSQPIVLIKTPSGRDYDPSLVVSGPRVLVTCTTLPSAGGIRTSTTWCTRSDDGANTWSPYYEIPMNHRYTCGKTHRGIRLKSGTLLMGYSWDVLCEKGQTLQQEGEMHLRAGVMISTDNGATWPNGGDTDAQYEKVSAGAVRGTDEPAIVELDDATIYMLMRTGSDRLYEARSRDEGRTWTDIRPSPLTGSNAPAALCKFVADGRRGILCVWDNALSRFPLCAAASCDGGRTWTAPKDIAGPTGGRQASYPSCEQAADGTLVAVWQQDVDRGRDVRCARFSLAWLLEKP